MCLALPGEVVRIEGETATVDVDGVQVPVSLAFLDDVAPGDMVIVHVGYALSKVDPDLAAEQIALMKAGGAQADGPLPTDGPTPADGPAMPAMETVGDRP
ncbi:MAG: HypC/HybG/HupF family hydrogenase formation chaperone [Alphaproteobacteria bacterium]